ncbi:DMT family transporter [Pelagibacterium lentulum]|uniref:ABC transporter permease n=1 Tax=Pelagibacterium lentulum TaxID=2029865 RepID=A0A916W2D3_9HYPH|nr:DMT family transporter [Pelagibacterium lentulum]GGA60544.1 ABC transporter permease [Pelagibacterium lentulum]
MATRDWLLVLFLGAIWGSSFIFNAVLIRELGPLWVSAGRVGVAAAASWIFFLALRKPKITDLGLIAKLALLGIFSYALPFALFPLGQTALASGVAAILNAMTPIMTVIVSHFWVGGERATPYKIAGVFAGLAGVVILSLPALGNGGESHIWAIGLCLLATFCYAVSLNWSRNFSGIDATTIATIALTGATAAAVPAALIFEGVPQIEQPQTWLAILGIGLLPTFVAFQVMYRILPRIGATNFSATTFIAPISTILLGIAILGEIVLPTHLLGMLAIFAGLLMIDGRLPRWIGMQRRRPAR